MDVKKFNSTENHTIVENLKRRWMATVDAMVDPMIIDKEYNIQQTNKANPSTPRRIFAAL